MTVRPVSLHHDLAAVLSLVSEGFGVSSEVGAFDRWRMGEYARLVDEGQGEWLGAWVGSTMVATAGVFECGGILRFQYPVTAPPHRRRGHASTLCRAALARHLGGGRLRAVAVAEPDGEAERLYRRLGYERVGWQLAWLADRNDVAVLAAGARR